MYSAFIYWNGRVVVVGNDLSNMDQVMNSKKYHGQAKDLIQNILKEL